MKQPNSKQQVRQSKKSGTAGDDDPYSDGFDAQNTDSFEQDALELQKDDDGEEEDNYSDDEVDDWVDAAGADNSDEDEDYEEDFEESKQQHKK